MTRAVASMRSPVGVLTLTMENERLVALTMTATAVEAESQGRSGALADALLQLAAYFSGALKEFDVDLAPAGTAFQQKAWQALRTIPYGETISYGEQAARIGNRNASRAVGAANGKNPVAIIVPCHRVIGANASLTGYAGGVETKAWLLAHEATHR